MRPHERGCCYDVLELRAGYGDVQILHGLSLDAEDGAITALLGANGAGKTTLMRTLCGLLPVRGGRSLSWAKTSAQGRRIGACKRDWCWCRKAGWCSRPRGRENLRLGAITPKARRRWRARRDEMYDLFPRLRERARKRRARCRAASSRCWRSAAA